MSERWADMPGFPGYEISSAGKAARLTGSGREIIKPVKQEGRLYYRMRLGGSRRMLLAERAVALAFMPEFTGRDAVRHADGDPFNCRLDNLQIVRKKTAGRRICKIDAEGRILEEYESASEAGRENYMSYQTVLQRCRGVTQRPFRDGFSFIFKDREAAE